MRFHGLMLLRDEQDILAEVFDHLLTWIDALYVMDLGSTDGTWEIVQDYARRDPRIVPAMHAPTIYADGLRCLLFDRYRDRFAPGDWIMKIDADEFYQVPPPQFVRERMRPHESAAGLQWYFFRLTSREVADYESGRVNLAADRQRSIAERRRFYKITGHSEPRLFRYRPTMRWPDSVYWPYNMGVLARQRLPIRHYPHRDPLQMTKRHRLRAAMMKLQAKAGPHWRLEDWRTDVVQVDAQNRVQAGSATAGLGAVAGHDDGPLLEWSPGTPLPEVRGMGHLPPLGRRVAQGLIYRTPLVTWLDGRRTPYDRSYQPTPIPAEVNAHLYDGL